MQRGSEPPRCRDPFPPWSSGSSTLLGVERSDVGELMQYQTGARDHRQRAAPAPTIPVAFLRWLLKRHDLAFSRTHAWRDQERAPPKSANTPHKSWCDPRSSGPRPKPTSTVRAASWPARSWRRRSGLRRNARPPRPGGRARDLGRSVCWLAGRVLRKVAERGVDHKTARCYVTAAEGCAGTPESRR